MHALLEGMITLNNLLYYILTLIIYVLVMVYIQKELVFGKYIQYNNNDNTKRARYIKHNPQEILQEYK